jgi:hypothetical protein
MKPGDLVCAGWVVVLWSGDNALSMGLVERLCSIEQGAVGIIIGFAPARPSGRDPLYAHVAFGLRVGWLRINALVIP